MRCSFGLPDSTLELTWPAARLGFWWLFGGSLLLAGVWHLRCGVSAMGGLALLAASGYVLGILAPSLAAERIVLDSVSLSIHTGRWTHPYVIRFSLSEVSSAYEFGNARWTVDDRYLIFEYSDYSRQRFRQTPLFRIYRQSLLAALAAQGIQVRIELGH